MGYTAKEESKMERHLALLGFAVEDVVTGLVGIVVSISFDLSGCVQAFVTPRADKEGKVATGFWVDTKRLKATSDELVTPVASFEQIPGGTALPPHPSKAEK